MEMKMQTYDKRHGGPYDRGSADAYYQRRWMPHYYTNMTHQSDRIEMRDMTPEDIAAYSAGFEDQINSGDFKDWG